MNAKRVEKPWGWEQWFALNDHYCYKRIFIKAGTRTSLQYHKFKVETNYVISGKAEVWLENDDGIIEKKIMKSGDFFDVAPPKQHRVVALTDVILQEVSTPHVDDVIRVEDDSNRPDGRIESEHLNPVLCLLTAGLGTRLESLTGSVNKALLPVEDKAIISHIIDLTPSSIDIVVSLGYCGNLVRDYLTAVYPNRQFTFVEVDNITGPESGPGYSLLTCREYLNRPFYWITADCLVDELPSIDGNWIGVCETGIPELYATVDFDDDKNIKRFSNKSSTGFNHAFIGLAAIKEHEVFWQELEKNIQGSGEVVSAFYDFSSYKNFKVKQLDWTDVGTIDGYLKARNNKHSLPKNTGECLYNIKDSCPSSGHETSKCVKLFPHDIKNKISRVSELKEFLPNIQSHGSHVISYDWIEGSTLYERDRVDLYRSFLDWTVENLWSPVANPSPDLKVQHAKFYETKTKSRVEKFLQSNNKTEKLLVNGNKVLAISEILNNISWEELPGTPTLKWHGDLQFDNVIVNPMDQFTLIDWRDEFGLSKNIGDVNYDLAKLYGGIHINYREMRKASNAVVIYNGGDVTLNCASSSSGLIELRNNAYFEGWASQHGFCMRTIKTLTGLIYLSMTPIHEQPFADYLFYRAKELLSDR
jgi:choline kinase/quercetin dioxygenase-like cupin family protein/thiamine kinase-like enzyme